MTTTSDARKRLAESVQAELDSTNRLANKLIDERDEARRERTEFEVEADELRATLAAVASLASTWQFLPADCGSCSQRTAHTQQVRRALGCNCHLESKQVCDICQAPAMPPSRSAPITTDRDGADL